LLESVYEQCLAHELETRGVVARRQVPVPVVYRDIRIETGFRLDLLVADRVIVEVKAVEALLPVHTAQLLTYLKFADLRLGLLLNFHVPVLKQGIRRLVRSCIRLGVLGALAPLASNPPPHRLHTKAHAPKVATTHGRPTT
jgi:GxxExxY protein